MIVRSNVARLLVPFVAALVVAACVPAAGPTVIPSTLPPSSATSASPLASPSTAPTAVTTPEAAAALVINADPRFAGIGPVDPNIIGACCSWSAVPAADGWTVTVEIGWGDCPAGCINRHHWTYLVSSVGVVTFRGEDGPTIPDGVRGGGGDTTGLAGIGGIATAGPVCPVVRPNDPACADRPVAGATVHVLDATGGEVAQLETDENGTFTVTLPPGRYRLVADPADGLMRAPEALDVEVGSALVLVRLMYDTGIR